MNGVDNVSFEQVSSVAVKATKILSYAALRSCISGVLGCALVGCNQVPKVVDIVVLTNEHSDDQLKQLIVDADPDFFIRFTRHRVSSSTGTLNGHNSRRNPVSPSTPLSALSPTSPTSPFAPVSPPTPPRADTHTVSINKTLYCKVQENLAVKVVILTPGSTGFSLVPDDRINHNSLIPSLSTLPTIPLILILLHNWETHRSSPWPEEQWKEFGDIQNLNQLVDIAVEKGEHLANDKSWIPGKALEAGKKRFRDFAKQSGVTNIASWNAIGFSRYQFY